MKSDGQYAPKRMFKSTVGLGAMAALALLMTAVPASAAEKSLAGIRIFSSPKAILQKYKNPSRIIVGRPSLFPLAGGGAGGASGGGFGGGFSGGPGGPGGGGFPGGPSAGFSGAGGAGPSSGAMGIAPEGGGGGLPGFGGGGPGGFGGPPAGFGGMPGGFGGPPGASGSDASGAGSTASNPGEVTWIYDKPNGNDIEFTMSGDGRVIQIRATGYSFPGIRTAKGVTLGQTYAQVLSRYGYPESQEQMGSVLTARYSDSQKVAFQFYNQKLVAIIVAAVE